MQSVDYTLSFPSFTGQPRPENLVRWMGGEGGNAADVVGQVVLSKYVRTAVSGCAFIFSPKDVARARYALCHSQPLCQ
jgi:hypothetical protein